MNSPTRRHLAQPTIIGRLSDGRPVWSISGGADDTDTDDGDEVALSFEVPEDLAGLSDEDLATLHEQALTAFDELRPQAADLDDAGMRTLEAIAEAIERIGAEEDTRVAAREDRQRRADELAGRVRREDDDGGDGDGDGDGDETAEVEDGDPEAQTEEEAEEPAEEPVAAGSRSTTLVVNLAGVRRRQPDDARSGRDTGDGRWRPSTTMVAADGTPGLTAGAELDIDRLAEVLATRLEGMSTSAYERAYQTGERISTRLPAALIRRQIPDDLWVGRKTNTQAVITAAIERWREELPLGDVSQHTALTAAAWCAPSQPLYDLCELETTDDIMRIPSIGVDRGGVSNTTGPDFRDIFADSGFCFSSDELDAQSPPGSGPKPCYTVNCPEFTDNRLGVCGTCVRAGLLQNRAFPELVQRTVRGTITAHAHRLSSQHIAAIIAGSDPVALPAGQAGATAPILTAIELQTTHFRYVNRSGDLTLEAVFPLFVRGLIRSDLSRRLGIDLLNVTDAMISSWFTQRNISAQFVVNFDDITGNAADFTAWPDTVRFLLYAPGTWIAGAADVIRIDTLFDSALLAQNDFTALFMEEGLLTLKTCPDSRVVSVPVCPDGSTHGGIDIDCDGTEVTAG